MGGYYEVLKNNIFEKLLSPPICDDAIELKGP